MSTDAKEKTETVIKNEERAHHDYSPSSLQNLEACPCFQNRKGDVHVAAVRGTMQHAVTETGEDDHRLDDEEAGRAAECLDFYQREKLVLLEARQKAEAALIAQARAAGAATYIPPADVIDLTETYLPVDDLVFEDVRNGETRIVKSTTAGYVDRGLVSHDRKHGVLLDWKFGAWAVEKAEKNLQGIAYALGFFKKYPTLETVEFIFKMPALDYTTRAIFTRENVAALYLRVQTVVARAREARNKGDFATANPMIPVCNFCGNIGVCPKVAAIAIDVAKKYYPAAVPSDVSPTGLKDPEQTALCLRLSQVLAAWAKGIRAVISDRAIREQKVPEGYIIQTRADREIADPVKFKEVTTKYITADELAATASYTFGPIEELINDKTPRGQKEAVLNGYKAELEESGAVKKGNPYTFLKAVSKKDE